MSCASKSAEASAHEYHRRKQLVRETLRFDAGHILAPTAPRLGVELNEEAYARSRYERLRRVSLFDGSMKTSGVAIGAAAMTVHD